VRAGQAGELAAYARVLLKMAQAIACSPLTPLEDLRAASSRRSELCPTRGSCHERQERASATGNAANAGAFHLTAV